MANTLDTKDGQIFIFSGASRNGKTVKAVREVRKFKNAIVWDVQAQWSQLQGFKRITSMAEMIAISKTGRKGRFAYVPLEGDLKEQFNKICKCAFHYGAFFGRLAFVAEELAAVTTSAKAPAGWGQLITQGLKYEISLFAISQRWQEADKTAIGNASQFYLFRQVVESDRKYISEKTDVPVERIRELKKLEYLHLDVDSGVVTGSKLTF